MSRPKKLNDEQIAAAQVMWLARVRRKIIASRFGVSRETIRRQIKNATKLKVGVMRHLSDSSDDEPVAQLAS